MRKIFPLPSQYKRYLSKIILVLLLLFSYSSCTDQGCIEADDFGEYEQQVLTIEANASSKSCEFDSAKYQTTKTLLDGQGEGLKKCFSYGSVDISDGTTNGACKTSSGGCNGLTQTACPSAIDKLPVLINLCVNQCIQRCLTDQVSSAGSEPNWVSTSAKDPDRNIGVTILPGAEIYIRAIGNVILGGDVSLPDVKVPVTKPLLQSELVTPSNPALDKAIVDVQSGSIKYAKFSSLWNDQVDNGNTANQEVGAIYTSGGGGILSSNKDIQAKAFNSARRLVAYLIPRPDGYSFDSTKFTEKTGTTGIPIMADVDMWNCTYDGDSLSQSSCGSSSYKAGGYVNISADSDTILKDPVANPYRISSIAQLPTLGTIGGMILSTDVIPDSGNSDDPMNISDPIKADGTVDDVSRGGILQNSAATSLTNNSENAVKLSFKNLSTDSSCTVSSTTVNIESLKNKDDVSIIDASNQKLISIDATSWKSAPASDANNDTVLEAGDKIIISSTENTGCNIAYRIDKFRDITINKSGYVSLSILPEQNASGLVMSSGSCIINTRIINPLGNRKDINSNYTADFYERDTIGQIVVSASSKWSSGKIFLRKGQVLRFDPSSWGNIAGNSSYNKWYSGAGLTKPRACGIGMAMKIEERPALLCRGSADNDVANPLCRIGLDTSGTTICQEYEPECDDSNSTSYCPTKSCRVSSPADSCATGGATVNKCKSCYAKQKANAEQHVTIASTLLQCYDLENYRGKVSNIPADKGFSSDDLKDDTKAKGAVILAPFNGTYGNFEGIEDDKTTNPKTNSDGTVPAGANIVYRLKNPLIFSRSGRLQFLVLDGNDFENTDSSGNATSYQTNTGFYKVYLSGTQEFSNGKMLEVKLCLESSDTSSDCATSSEYLADSPALINQPKVVEIDHATATSQNPSYISYYKFDDYGSLMRFTNPSAIGTVPTGAISTPPQNFYEHYYQYVANSKIQLGSLSSSSTPDERQTLINRLRLSFKILDTDLADPACNGGIKLSNKYYVSKSGNTGATCSNQLIGTDAREIPGSGDPNTADGIDTKIPYCQKEFVCTSKYSNNSGSYQVIVKVKNKDTNLSNIVNSVISPIVSIIDGPTPNCNIQTGSTLAADAATFNGLQYNNTCVTLPAGEAERIYKLVVNNFTYQAILNVCLIIMISFYGVGYLMGVSEFSQSEIISRIIKIGVIYLFVSPEGWYWFNKFFVNFFKHGTDYMAFLMASSFDNSADLQQAIADSNFHNKSILFASVDNVFGVFFSPAVQKKISGLLFADIFGWAYLVVIYMSFLLYVYAVANAILLYLTAQVFISVLFVLGPIFFIFLLFNQTKDMFDKWLSQLIGFSLQQIFLLTTLTFFNMMMYEVLKLSLGYRVCWDDVIVSNLIARIKLLSFWTVASMPPRLDSQTGVGSIASTSSSLPSFFSILFIWVIASLMKQFIAFMTDLAADIGGGLRASELSSSVAKAASGLQNTFSKGLGKIGEKLGNPLQKIDRALFDSGKLAKQERHNRQVQNQKDATVKKSMANAGDKAVEDYKIKNAMRLANMDAATQSATLKGVKESAMVNQAKKLGRSAEEAEKLLKDKGLKYEGTNVFGATGQALKQGMNKGGALTTSLSEKKVQRDYSTSTVGKAMKNLTTDERKDFMGKIISSDVKLQDGLGTRMKSSISESASTVGRAFYDKKYNEAAKQLEDEGAISKMRFGTGWSSQTDLLRKEGDKEQIKKRMAEMEALNGVKSRKNENDAVKSASMKRDIADSLDAGAGGKLTRKEGSLAAKLFGKEKGLKNKVLNKINNIDNDQLGRIGDNYLTNLNAEAEALDLQEATALGDLANSLQRIDNLENDPTMLEVENLRNQIEHSGGEERQAKIQEMTNLMLSQDYKDKNAELQRAKTNVIKYQNTANAAGTQARDTRALATKFSQAQDTFNTHATRDANGKIQGSEVTKAYRELLDNGQLHDNEKAIDEFNSKNWAAGNGDGDGEVGNDNGNGGADGGGAPGAPGGAVAGADNDDDDDDDFDLPDDDDERDERKAWNDDDDDEDKHA